MVLIPGYHAWLRTKTIKETQHCLGLALGDIVDQGFWLLSPTVIPLWCALLGFVKLPERHILKTFGTLWANVSGPSTLSVAVDDVDESPSRTRCAFVIAQKAWMLQVTRDVRVILRQHAFSAPGMPACYLKLQYPAGKKKVLTGWTASLSFLCSFYTQSDKSEKDNVLAGSCLFTFLPHHELWALTSYVIHLLWHVASQDLVTFGPFSPICLKQQIAES